MTSFVFLATVAGAMAQTVQMTIVNQCSTTIYPGITAGNYPNTNWTLAPGASVSINVPTNLAASRVWARKNCNTSVNPWQCDADQGNTTLVEFTLSGQPGGVDWYDISDVDAYSFPVTLTSSAGTNVTATNDVLRACPAELQVKNSVGTVISCENPCNYYKTSLVCQSILSPQNTRDVVNEWPAPAQQYVNLIHNYAGETYAYPYDDWWGLHTVATGANWTITFCPNGLNPTPGNNAAPFPLAPYNVQGSSSGTTATLTWQASAGATSYKVYRSTTEGSSSAIPEDAPIATVTTNSFNDSGLVAGTKYYYIITAVNASGFSAPSAELWLTGGGGTGQTIPKALGAVTATGGSGQVTLTWPSSSGATSYDVYPSLQPQGEAQFGLTSTPGDAQIALSWSTISGATSYNVYRGTTSGSETQIASNITNLYYMDGGLANGTTYYYKVAPVSSGGVVGTMTNETASSPVAGSGTPLLHSNPWVYSTTSTSFTHTGLTNGQTYYYIVLPHNAVGQGGGSNEINATPSTTVYPAGDLTINCGGGAVSPWIADTDFSGGAASQSSNPINVTGVTNPAPGAVYQSSRYGSSTYTIGGLSAGASYTVRLHFAETFHNAAGQRTFNVLINGSQVLTNFDIYATAGGQNKATVQQFTATANSSGQIAIQFVTVVDNAQINGIEVYPNSQGAPAAPTGLNATSGNGQVSLSWLGSAGATSYNVYRSTTSGAEALLASGITGTSYTDTGVTNGTTYYYKVAAVNSVGTSGMSGEVGATPQSAPSTPTNLAASAGNGQVALTWSAVTNATSYNLYRGTTAGGESATPIATGITSTSYTDTGVTNGTTYYYKLAAVNSFGTSGMSNEASATPQGATGSGGISINCGGAAASPFVADVDFTGGATASVTNTIDTSLLTGTIPPQAVLQSNRYGAFTYTVPNLTANASYPVTLYFAEEYWTAAGKRIFNVAINGTTVLTNFDIYATAGAAFKAVQKSFTATANSSGQIVITTTNVTDNAQINGIVVGSGSGGGNAPAAPTGLSATAGNAQVSLSWTGSTGAASYNVYRGTTAGGESTTAIATGLIGTSYTDTGLTNGTTYYYKVAAVNGYGTSGMSNEASATPVSNTGNGGISINCGGSAASPFVADVDFTGGGTQVVTNTIDTSLLTGTVPPQAVLQSNRYGAVTYTIPNLTANASYPVTLYFAEEYWTASGKRTFNVSINGTNVLTNFDIYATAGTAFKAVQKSFTATANSSGQIVITTTNVTDNAQINGIVVGSGSGGGGNAPAAPSGLSATAGNAQVSLSWTASSGATSYNVYRGTAAGGESTTAIATGLTGTTYTNTGLTNGTTYYYKVAAVNTSGTSGMSNEASSTPQAATTIAINSGGAATGSWVADTDFTGGGSVTWTNTVDTSLLSGTVPPQAVLQSDREGGFTYTIPNLTAGSSHTVTLYFVEQYWTATGKRVFSVTSNGTTVISNLDIYATAGADYKVIQKSFTATANSSGQIVLQFTASADQAKCSGIVVN
jgi:fibronectin type 3 domain-containing protein